MTTSPIHILLADDDEDDRFLFKEAIDESKNDLVLITVNDGRQLMTRLQDQLIKLPDVIFLDLNMPFKSGHECLKEIKNDPKLQEIPIIIYSTSSDINQIESTYQGGANLYVQKPDSIDKLENIISAVFSIDWSEYKPQPLKEKYVFKY